VIPVPSHPTITTPFGRRGRHWSCNRDAAGNGIHTGVDYGSPGVNGARVVAARPGTARHVNYGNAFGTRQLAIVTADGTVDFYAHMATRLPADGARVTIGQHIGTVGASGNVTGPHLHFERHSRFAGWSCGIILDPQASIDYQQGSWFDMATEAQLRAIVRAEVERAIPAIATRVNGILGDFDAQGAQRRDTAGHRGDVRLRNVLDVVREIRRAQRG
jgi:murein DD-endopeptidase MepM/ murein hydrolase activator NlpD